MAGGSSAGSACEVLADLTWPLDLAMLSLVLLLLITGTFSDRAKVLEKLLLPSKYTQLASHNASLKN